MLSSSMQGVMSYFCESIVPPEPPTLERCQEVLAANPVPSYANVALLAATAAAVPVGLVVRKIRYMIYSKDKRLENLIEVLKNYKDDAASQKNIELALRGELDILNQNKDDQEKFEKEILGKMTDLHMEMNTYKKELVFVNSKHTDLIARVDRVMNFVGNSEIVADQLQDMVSLSLTLLDDYSQSLITANQLKSICEKENIFLQERVINMTEKIQTKEAECVLLLEKVTLLDDQIKSEENNSAYLQEKVTTQDSEIKKREQEYAELKEHFTDIEGQIHAKTQECTELQEKVSFLNDQVMKKNEECKQMQDAMIKQEEDHNAAMSYQKGCHDAEIQKLLEKVTFLNHQMVEKDEEWKKMKAQLETEERKHFDCMIRNVNLEEDVKDVKRLCQRRTHKCEEWEAKYTQLEKINFEHMKEIKSQLDEIMHLKDKNLEVQKLMEKVTSLNDQLIKKDEDYKQIKDVMMKQEVQNAAMSYQNECNDAEIQKLQENLSILNDQMIKKDEECKQVQAQLETEKRKHFDCMIKNVNLEEDVKDVKRLCQRKTHKCEQWEAKNTQLEKIISEHMAENKSQLDEIIHLKDENLKHLKMIDTIKTKTKNALDCVISGWEERYNASDGEKDHLKNQISGLYNDLAKMTNEDEKMNRSKSPTLNTEEYQKNTAKQKYDQ